MLHARLVSALKKVGAEVTELDQGGHFNATVSEKVKDTHKWFKATLNGNCIDWYTSENYNLKLGQYDGRLFVGHVTMRSPYTDSMTDCFCDSYRDTIKGAIGLLGA